MVFPVLTAFYAAVLSLIFAALSIWVIAGRTRFRALHGDGGNSALNRRIRIHANFAEYVPLVLLMVGLLEAGGASQGLLRVLLVVLVAARIMHPIGMLAAAGSIQQYACRAGGMIGTVSVLIISAALLLARAT